MSSPAACDGLEGIGKNRLADDADLPEAHQQGGAADAVEPFQGDQFLIAEGAPVFANLAQQMLAFIETYNQTPKPFKWTYSGKVLEA